MSISRRKFLGTMGAATLVVASATLTKEAEAQLETKRYAMYIDVSKCYGCMACVAACASETNVPLGVFRTWVEKITLEGGTLVFIPKICNHCEHPSCVDVCPVNATYKREDGLVLIDDELCIGCGACINACPYGARYHNPVKGIADKCTFCEHRLDKGLLPACVEACPTTARVFGNLYDDESTISKLVDEYPTQVLKPETGNEPMVFYRDLPKEGSR